MNRFYCWVTCAFFLCAGFFTVSKYGSRWGFGDWGLPKNLISEDGAHYLDGASVDPITSALVNSGWETAINAVLLGFFLLVGIILFFQVRKMNRGRRELERLTRLNRANGKPRS